jgi:hypothetical protein
VLSEPGTIDELLSRANATTDMRLKDSLIQRAVLKASSSGDFERALEMIELLSNEAHRVSASDGLRQRMDQKRSSDARAALKQGDFDKAEELAAKISNRFLDGLLVRDIISQLSRTDKSRATRILDEYAQRAAALEEPTARALRMMQVAHYAASLDSYRVFEQMKRAIEEFNKADFVPELEKYRANHSGEAAKRVAIGLNGLPNNWDLHWMGSDFERAVALTGHFRMKEAAALVQLSICRGALARLPRTSLTR